MTSQIESNAIRRGRERGWGTDLIARIEALRVPESMVDAWIRWEDSPERVAQALERFEQVTYGSLRQREATTADNERLCELFADTAERIGDYEITVERSPYAFAQFRLQDNVQIQVLEEDAKFLAVIARSTRNALVGSIPLNVRFTSALRVHPSGRGRGLSLYVRSASPACTPYANADYWYFRSRNFRAREWLRGENPDRLSDAPPRIDDVPGIPVTVLNYPASPFDGDAAGIRFGRREDVPICIQLINETHAGQDLFRPYTEEFMQRRLDDGGWGPKPEWWTRVYGWGDYWVLEERGEIVACAGLWDRGRHIRERHRHVPTGEEATVAATAVLDFGHAGGRPDALARLVDFLIGRTHELRRSFLMAPLQQLPSVQEQLAAREPVRETWSMQWEYFPPENSGVPEQLAITRPYTDLAYW